MSFRFHNDAEIFFPRELLKIRISKVLKEYGADFAVIKQIVDSLCIDYYNGSRLVRTECHPAPWEVRFFDEEPAGDSQ